MKEVKQGFFKRLFAMDEDEPSSDEPIRNPPTVYDTLKVIRVNNIEEFYACENMACLNAMLGPLYGHIMLHSKDRNLLFRLKEKMTLSPKLIDALNDYFERFDSYRQILTFHGANIDDAVREAGHIQFIQEMSGTKRREFRDLYR